MHTIHHPDRAKPQNQPTDRHREALNCAARSFFITDRGVAEHTCIHALFHSHGLVNPTSWNDLIFASIRHFSWL
ncbi:uncharacterized protein PgNI_04208 [Pyricularia grisea]|uniref:Uncharacterized protein n=1 Tax=Pyricularia grisea TaxID=148305 RepID=A0A6P8BFG6_PYRGI|nr:uncharacterized protein PgNI_04208 [Pyricularia grisea]TLD14439.1 hypothetical protein PgNI_04208 [Pyricularia grisea]